MSLVTLSFDNGPSTEVTPAVLDHLQVRNLTAYFCLVGAQLKLGQENVDIALETRNRGHVLVNHSFTHRMPLGEDRSLSHAVREVTDMHSLMESKLSDLGDRWFRPFGRGGQLGRHLFSRSSVEELRRLNYSVLLWNSVPRDWEDPEGWVNTALRELEQNDHTVVVLHDLDTGAMKHLPQFLDILLERGDEITTRLPDSCVPMRNGQLTWEKHQFNALVSNDL